MAQQRDLPHDLIAQNILTRLPIKPLVRFKSVSKLWYSTLSSRQFALSHFKFPHYSPTESLIFRSNKKFQFCILEDGDQSAVDDAQSASKCEMNLVDLKVDFDAGNENLALVGSCNGLVCLGSTSGCLFIVWNPITREFRRYSDSEIGELVSSGTGWSVTWGFGYVSAVDDYKIVRICKKVFVQSIRVHVFSIRLDKWTRIDNDPSHNFSDLRTSERLSRPGVLVNETLYWVGGVPPMLEGLQRKILSFDLALGLFDTFPHLGVSSPTGWGTIGEECFDEFLCVVNGCLSKYGRFVVSGEGVITMLKSSGETEQIVLSRDLIASAFSNLIGFTGSGKLYAQYHANHKPQLGVIDISLRPMKHTQLMTLERSSKIEITSYSATLISPALLDDDRVI